MNVTTLQVFLDELIHFGLFVRCKGVDLAVHWFRTWNEFNHVIPYFAIR